MDVKSAEQNGTRITNLEPTNSVNIGCVCVCVCVCVCEGEWGGGDGVYVWVCVCMNTAERRNIFQMSKKREKTKEK